MNELDSLKKRIERIEARNTSVESNKAWETSYTRRALLMCFTYLAIASYMAFIVHIDPWINAVVPTVGFLLSTLTLPLFKGLWTTYIYKK